MDKKKTKNSKRKEVLKKIGIKSAILIVLIGFIALLIYSEREKTNELVNIRSNNLTENIEENQNILNDLEKRIEDLEKQNEELKQKDNELNQKNEELEKTIEKLKISKVETKTQVTSRSGSTISRQSTVAKSTSEWKTAVVTAYCGCTKCCGKATGKTASGTQAAAGRTIAASSQYAFGTKIEIEGYGTYTVEDRGGAIQGNKIDMYFSSHKEALNFGKKTLSIRVIN